MPEERASGILLHPTSLPGPGGMGDLGGAAYHFLDFLAASNQRYWQVLPLSPTGLGNSPYSATSAFAGNPLLISLDRLVERGWLGKQELPKGEGTAGRIDYTQASSQKLPLLERAAKNFLSRSGAPGLEAFHRFRSEKGWWLEDFALFDVLRQRHRLASWNTWPAELMRRHDDALQRVRNEMAAEIEVACAIQFAFFEQWRSLREYGRRRGVKVIGDVAIFVNYDSADVWTHPELFCLNQDLEPEMVAGVPPDAFSDTGQRWGNPLYRWDVMRERGYEWWKARMYWAQQLCDMVRLDHFRGFQSFWEIPANESTAINGRWVQGPADDLFHALRHSMGGLPFIAEDLGLITDEVIGLRERFGLPGMKVMQFGFGDRGSHIYLPHRYVENCVAYTGTHDNDTTVGWWKNSASDEERAAAAAYFGGDTKEIHWAFIKAVFGSIAKLCVVPLQDVLGLDSEARMNIPSNPEGNWKWRYSEKDLTPALAAKLRALADVTDRNLPPFPLPGEHQGHGESPEHFAA